MEFFRTTNRENLISFPFLLFHYHYSLQLDVDVYMMLVDDDQNIEWVLFIYVYLHLFRDVSKNIMLGKAKPRMYTIERVICILNFEYVPTSAMSLEWKVRISFFPSIRLLSKPQLAYKQKDHHLHIIFWSCVIYLSKKFHPISCDTGHVMTRSTEYYLFSPRR